MSEEKFRTEADRWFAQAVEDLDAARVLKEGEKYAQACFYCQQAGEKALKALGWLHGADLWGHSLLNLSEELGELGFRVTIDEVDLAALDRLYIPTRYPNGLPVVIPQRAFLLTDAEGAIGAAKRIIAFVRGHVRPEKER